jgi:hypothetical protein
LTAAAVVAVVFLVRLFIQLRTTVAEAEKTLVEARVLIKNLSELDLEVKSRVEELGSLLGTSREAGDSLSGMTMLATSKLLPAPARFLPLVLPLVRFAFRKIKKRKG